MKHLLAVFLCAALLFCISCASSQNSSEDYLTAADAVIVTEDAVSFADASGTTVTITKNPAKTYCLYASFTTLWYEAGGTVDGCVGGDSAVQLYKSHIGRDITGDADVTVLAKSAQAKGWSVETILAGQPSLILCSTAMGGYDTLRAPCEAAGIPIVAVDYDDFADYLKWFKVFCHLNGRPELWESVAMAALSDVNAVIASCPTENAPTVFCMFTGETSLKASTSNTMLGGMVKELGGINIADGMGDAERFDINLEAVYSLDPDVILVQCHTGDADARATVERLYGDNPVWQSLRAVKEGRVYYLDNALFHNKPNRRFVHAYDTLAELLYPTK